VLSTTVDSRDSGVVCEADSAHVQCVWYCSHIPTPTVQLQAALVLVKTERRPFATTSYRRPPSRPSPQTCLPQQNSIRPSMPTSTGSPPQHHPTPPPSVPSNAPRETSRNPEPNMPSQSLTPNALQLVPQLPPARTNFTIWSPTPTNVAGPNTSTSPLSLLETQYPMRSTISSTASPFSCSCSPI